MSSEATCWRSNPTALDHHRDCANINEKQTPEGRFTRSRWQSTMNQGAWLRDRTMESRQLGFVKIVTCHCSQSEYADDGTKNLLFGKTD